MKSEDISVVKSMMMAMIDEGKDLTKTGAPELAVLKGLCQPITITVKERDDLFAVISDEMQSADDTTGNTLIAVRLKGASQRQINSMQSVATGTGLPYTILPNGFQIMAANADEAARAKKHALMALNDWGYTNPEQYLTVGEA